MGWSVVKLGNSWAKANGTQVLRFKYHNDTSYKQTISNISCLLGSGKGTAWASNDSTYYGDGKSCTAVLYYYGTDSEYETKVCDLGTASVTQSASVSGTKDSNGAYFWDANGDGKRTAAYTDASGVKHAAETGYFPLNGSATYKVTFSGSRTINAGDTVYFAVAKSSGASQILTAHSGSSFSSQIISSTVDTASCTISNVSISPTVIIPGNGSVTASASGNSGSSKSYQWYNSAGTKISGATSATRNNPDAGDYCIITISKTDYKSITGTTTGVKHYGKPGRPTGLTITSSNDDGRYTNREDYTFSWTKAVTDGANGNNLNGYEYCICVNNDNTNVQDSVNKNTNSIKKTTAVMTANPLYIAKGKKLYFKVRTLGSANYHSDWVKSAEVEIVSSAVAWVNDSGWNEGIVYINKGTADKPNWVEAEDVYVNNGTEWETSV